MLWLVMGVALVSTAACTNGEAARPTTPVALPSGLTYLDLEPGQGDPVVAGQTAVVHYTGWVQEQGRAGRRFGSSHDGAGVPFTFKVGAGEVIKGWDEGVPGMRAGGRRRLIVPPALIGYGASLQTAGIPADATLIFEVDLLEIRP